MKSFLVGQRWISESEPELGLGVIVEVESKTVTCFFPAAKVDRRYGLQTAPLRRIEFNEGDEVKSQEGDSFIVESKSVLNGLTVYKGADGKQLMETQLSDTLSFSRPEERLFAGNIDSNELFKLRYDVLLNQRKQFISPIRGFQGPKLSLIAHQFYVAQEVVSRARPRVLLADEVGLGKTIEAGLILHQLILSGRVSKVLIIVPDSLVYQWFVEMLRKFSLSFTTINHDSKIQKGENPFEDGQLFVASLKYLMQEESVMVHAMETQWDQLVVDEAHQLRWSPERSSPEYDFVYSIAQKTNGVLLLSGTPEILGLAGHFARLQMLDPDRFHDYNQFVEETTTYGDISELAKTLLSKKDLSAKMNKVMMEKVGFKVTTEEEKTRALQILLDQHGTGRVYFRNTRKNMATYNEFFPKRVFHPYKLSIGKAKNAEKKLFEEKVNWLVNFLNTTKTDKTLLICHDKEVVVDLEKVLKDKSTAKVAFFHSGMNLMNRDRQAAYFADPEGANILLSTEIGSEGRNFEFAKHLVLFDLPKLPDLLEQRIGRLDRIGQKNDVQIHIPYLEDSADEVLLRWYHEGLNAFESSPRGATELYATVREELLAVTADASENGLDEKMLKAFIQRTKELHEEIESRLEDGQDKLVELNSFNYSKAETLIKELKTNDELPDLENFMLSIFERLGVDVDEIDEDTFFVRPGDNMYLPYFPALPSEGMAITFKRDIGRMRDDMSFITWDHPMVTGIMELIQSKEMGNCTLATWNGKAREPFLFEGYFVLSTVAEKRVGIERFFPPTPLRVIINSKFQDLTTKIPKKMIDEEVITIPEEKKAALKDIPRDFVKECIKKSKEYCLPRAKQYKDKFREEMLKSMDSEIARLESLREVNPTVSMKDIVMLKHYKNVMLKAIDNAELSLDSLRVII